jgi:hypothetical protein
LIVWVKNIFSLRKIELNKINVVYGFTTSVRRDRGRDYDQIPVTVTWLWPKKTGHAGHYPRHSWKIGCGEEENYLNWRKHKIFSDAKTSRKSYSLESISK